MAKIRIKLTDEHIKLIKEFRIENIGDNHVGIDTIEPYGGAFLMEDLALILGFWDSSIEGTEKDYDGKKFGLENEQYMIDIHMYLMDNIQYILSILLQFSSEGIKAGIYSASGRYLKWTFSEQ